MSTRSNLKQKAFFVNEVTVRRAQRALGAATDAEAVRLSGNASRRIGFDLLLRGARSVDSGSELVGALLADPLDLPRVTRAVGLVIEADTGRIVAHEKLEKGRRQTYAAIPPAVITVEHSARWLG